MSDNFKPPEDWQPPDPGAIEPAETIEPVPGVEITFFRPANYVPLNPAELAEQQALYERYQAKQARRKENPILPKCVQQQIEEGRDKIEWPSFADWLRYSRGIDAIEPNDVDALINSAFTEDQ